MASIFKPYGYPFESLPFRKPIIIITYKKDDYTNEQLNLFISGIRNINPDSSFIFIPDTVKYDHINK